MVKRFTEGDTIRLSGNFKVGTTNTDPTGVKFQIKNPSGTITTYIFGTDSQLVKDSVGNYHVDFLVNVSGDWNYSFEGTGATAPGRKETRFAIENSKIL
ncbi:MAG: hypothetical protein AABY07_03255 [Nanoarchaeota archaeon]